VRKGTGDWGLGTGAPASLVRFNERVQPPASARRAPRRVHRVDGPRRGPGDWGYCSRAGPERSKPRLLTAPPSPRSLVPSPQSLRVKAPVPVDQALLFVLCRKAPGWTRVCSGNVQRYCGRLIAGDAQGIAAEIPQEERSASEELERKARFFEAAPQAGAQKMRPGPDLLRIKARVPARRSLLWIFSVPHDIVW
jgi:hypothetical protein